MTTLIEYPTDGGGSVVVEVDTPAAGVVPVGVAPGEIAARATQTFEQALDRIAPVAAATIDRLARLADAPDEITVTFGIKLTADIGAVLAHAGGQANIGVTLRWTGARDRS